MKITHEMWDNYIEKLSQINKKAADLMTRWVNIHGYDDRERLIKFANSLVLHYGESVSALACRMYDSIASKQNADVPSAEPAPLPKYGDVAKAVNGAIKQSESGKILPQVIQRLTKQFGVDAMIHNANRDGAYFAWVPHGNETCPYCFMLSATGWHKAGKKTLQGKYIGHVHANCKCEYVIDFKGNLEVEGYDPAAMDEEVRKFFEGDEDSGIFGARDLLTSTWSKKRGKANYIQYNKYRRFKYRQKMDLEYFAKKKPKRRKVPRSNPLWDSLVMGDKKWQKEEGIFPWEHGGYEYLIEYHEDYEYSIIMKRKKPNIHDGVIEE